MASIISAGTTSGTALNMVADTTGVLQLATGATPTTAVTIDTSQNVGIGTTSPSTKLDVNGAITTRAVAGEGGEINIINPDNSTIGLYVDVAGSADVGRIFQTRNNSTLQLGQLLGTGGIVTIATAGLERMRIDSSGNVLVGTTTFNPATTNGIGATLEQSGVVNVSRNTEPSFFINRKGNDGGLVNFYQDGNLEGSISVSGSTVSYNGGHISRWSQLFNETTKVEVYRGTVLESVDAMCEWEKDGQPLPNEQSTKTIVSTTPSSKAVAGVFDRYDEDDQDNPYDFYVAQSGDFVIRIAQGVTVQNGDLLESAGDGTARPQADDICRSSTIAKVTSNYVSATYEDGSYCVPCILMIG